MGSRKNPGPKASLSLSLPACGCWKQFLSLSCLSLHRKLPEHCCLSHRSNGNWTRLRSFVFTPASATTCVESDVSARFVHPHSQVTLVQQHVCPPHATHYPPNCAAKRIWQTLLSYIHMCKHLQARMKRVLGFLISRRISASIVLKSGPAGSHEVGKDAHSV